MADLSEPLMLIQVSLRKLNLTWQSDRVQRWLVIAGENYVKRCKTQGVKPFPLPPYTKLALLPDELVIKLAEKLDKTVRIEGVVLPEEGKDANN